MVRKDNRVCCVKMCPYDPTSPKYEYEDKLYCPLHHPPSIIKRRIKGIRQEADDIYRWKFGFIGERLLEVLENILKSKTDAFYDTQTGDCVCIFCGEEQRNGHDETCHFTIIEKLIEEIKGE